MLALSFDKERIQNIALSFVQNTKRVGMTKLCKLFYFFDIDVYKKTAFTATGLEYFAKERGPVPMLVWLK